MKVKCFKVLLVVIAIFFTIGMTMPADASSVYVYGTGYVNKYNADGSGGVSVDSPSYAQSLADDPLNNDVYYWSVYSNDRRLTRDNNPDVYDGSGGDRDILRDYYLSGINYQYPGMDFDPLTRTLFYSESSSSFAVRNTAIVSHDVDSSSWSYIYSASSTTNWVTDVVVDPLYNSIYWTDSIANTISRLSLNGSGGPEVLYSGIGSPTQIALDANAGTLFWTEIGAGANGYDSLIRSGNTQGSGLPSTLRYYDGDFGSSEYFRSIDVDPDAGKIYFTDSGSSLYVQTMDYDGQNAESFTTPSGSQIGGYVDVSSTANLAVAPEPVSSTLFVVGAATLGFRRFRKTLK